MELCKPALCTGFGRSIPGLAAMAVNAALAK
jgi:hypothetical protein